jgi:RNA polymerase sigma factor (sigma-70 family)
MSQTPTFNPDLRAALIAMVRKRVPEAEVEDIVQSTLAEAIESPHAPKDGESLRRWIFGVAKNKVVDYHRRAGRETFDMPDVAGSPAPHDEEDMLRWAERHLPEGDDAQKTLAWMLREGDGEKLESIAASEKLPAPRVRQRVSRLRRHLKQHWAKEVALLAAVGVAIGILVFWLKDKEKEQPIVHDPNAVPIDPRAQQIRKDALERCAASDWAKCVDGLDEAKRLDPAGDARPEVQKARQDAQKAKDVITPPPVPTTSAIPIPTLDPTDSLSPTPVPTESKVQAPTKPDGLGKKAAKPQPKPFDTESSSGSFPAPAGSGFTPAPQRTAVPPKATKTAAPPPDFSEKGTSK